MGPCPIQPHQLVASAGASGGGLALNQRSQDALKLPGLPHIICGPTPYRSMYVDIHCVMSVHH